ncbi:TPA: hypothetical protein JZ222_004272 [Escherichia coli]|nr:hypothetical protein [Escherichia coli]HAY1863868.1 hypothetical protein [Escherichia coli]
MKNPPRISPTFSRISRSAPPLMTLSKILTDIFHTANNLTYCKTTNQLCAGDASIALASAILSCDRYSIFEQDYPCSGLIRQAVRHTGHSVHTSLVTTFTCSVPLSGALFLYMCPYPMVIQDNRFLFALPCHSYPPGQKCIIGKNVQKFFLVIGIFVVGRTSASGHNCWHVQKNRCGD